MPKGGIRKGSGRKPLSDDQKKQSYATKLRPDQIEWLRSQKKAAALLEKLIDKEINKMEWFVSNGNSVGEYSDYYPVSFRTAQDAMNWAESGDFPDGYTIWRYDDGDIVTA